MAEPEKITKSALKAGMSAKSTAEPTEEQIRAGVAALNASQRTMSLQVIIAEIYRAMTAAAPKPDPTQLEEATEGSN